MSDPRAAFDINYWFAEHRESCPNCGTNLGNLHPMANLAFHFDGRCGEITPLRKPVATGSGEPNPYGLKVELELVPTPPASQPTVTQLARVAELLEELKFCSMSSGAQVRVAELREIVALLRAAEQK